VKLNVEYFPSLEKDAPFVFLLHGFTGSSADWIDIIPGLSEKFSYAAIDLIGHGKSDSPTNVDFYTSNSIVQQLDEVFSHFTTDKFLLIGYSMGGRAALSYAVQFPEKLAGLILEGTSAGIADEKLRAERILSDEKIVRMIEEKLIEEFIEFWVNQDLFASLKNLPTKKLAEIQNSKFKNLSRTSFGINDQKIGLINSLKGFGTGVMPPLHKKLYLVNCKTQLVTGELDKKFTQINSELVEDFPPAKHVVIKKAGHNVHLERPEEFVGIVNEFLECT
jgi:2-succinyl-6-hydroxy-2,4-cyclohexadiene-1-carboxylate synthase